jgi:hypothetical protein
MNDDVYKLFEILFNVHEWTSREIVILSIISNEMRNLIKINNSKINFVFIHQKNNIIFQQIFNSLKAINQLKNVISVNLINNDGIGVIETINGEELDLQKIVSVDIGYNSLDNNDKLAEKLSMCTKITNLELNNNNFDSDFLKKLFFVNNFSNLVLFDISATKIGVKGAEIIALELTHLQNLQKFNIGECNIGKEGAAIIGSNIGQCTGLTSLNMSFNDIGTKVATLLCTICTRLVSLNLKNNCIDDEEDEEFASKLNCLTRLKHLVLADNCIKKPSLFSEVIKNLELLDLSNTDFYNLNKYEENDAYNLALALAQNTSLNDLNLSGNDIERDPAEEIIFSLNCTNLFSLDLSENQIDDGVEGIEKYCTEKFRELKYLDTDDNMLWDKRYSCGR